jgi:hypothetical protein
MVAHVSKCVCSLYNPDLYRKSSSSQFQLNTPGQRPATTLRLTAYSYTSSASGDIRLLTSANRTLIQDACEDLEVAPSYN